MRQMQENTKKLERYNNELSTGKKILRPSDDPVSTLRSMQVNTILAENEQYKDNIDQALNWLDATEGSLGKLTDVLDRLKELTIMAANGTYEQPQMDAINDEVKQLREHVVQLANTSLAGRYIFSGFEANNVAYASHLGPYQGDQNKLNVEIGKGVTIDYSIPGDQVFDQVFGMMNNMVNFLQTGDKVSLSTTSLNDINNTMDNILTVRAGLGAKVRRLEMSLNRLDDVQISTTKLLSNLEDVDVAETIMNLKMQENVYRTSLASGARIIQPSLMDFLK